MLIMLRLLVDQKVDNGIYYLFLFASYIVEVRVDTRKMFGNLCDIKRNNA